MVARVHGVPPAAALSCGADIGAQEQGACGRVVRLIIVREG